MTASVREAAWLPDPLGAFESRYWDGGGWTPWVSRNGQRALCPMELELLSGVSIGGRMAYAIACLQSLVRTRPFPAQPAREAIGVLASFLSSTDLGAWDREAGTAISELIEAGALVGADGDTTLAEACEEAYQEIGRGNLYEGVSGSSTATFNGCLLVACIVHTASAPLPDPVAYTHLRFEDHPWGLPIAPSAVPSEPPLLRAPDRLGPS